MSICSESLLVIAREHSMPGVGPIGEIMAAGLHRAGARQDTAGCLFEAGKSLPRAVIEDLVLSVSSCLTSVAPAQLCGEGAP